MPDGTPTRPALRYHGGKWRLAPWIIQHFPAHQVYVEPFGGAASVLLRKPRSYAEIYNDLDDEVVGLFRVLRSPRAAELVEAVRLTPFARAEIEECYQPTDEPVERARRMIARSFMGFGSNAHNIRVKTGFRSNSNRSGSTPARDWANIPQALAAIVERFSGVVIENRDALEVMQKHDGPDTLHYLDPPYVHETRSSRLSGRNDYHGYKHEMTDAQHAAVLAGARGLEGMVILSGYPHPLYDDALPGWERILHATHADGARKRIEALWLNPAAQRGRRQRDLMTEAAHA
jgi:DNA adenine methylase